MTKLKLFNKLRENQDLSDLFYPEAKNWMWNCCLFLGKFTDLKGKNWDLGIYIEENRDTMAAIVYNNKPFSYNSGKLNKSDLEEHKSTGFEHYVETIIRATKLGLL